MPEPGSPHLQMNGPRSSLRSRVGRAPLAAAPVGFPVVGIGASAGGLDACTKLVEAIQAKSGIAFIIVQHLEPNHASMMVELLATHTSIAVQQAADGMRLEPDHLYVIPPGQYLSVRLGVLHLSEPQTQRGARLPFDVLLHSLAKDCGQRAVCVILSGMGSDGSLGLAAIKEKGGLVIAQDPDEAGYDGMPKSAIATGAVDLVLPVAQIAGALLKRSRQKGEAHEHEPDASTPTPTGATGGLPEIIELLRTRTSHDFTAYKAGTLQRRVQRRMAMASIEGLDMGRYLEQLRGSVDEVELLAKDLLINVTSFFRDPAVFAKLAKDVIPDLIRTHPSDQPLRIWIAGCSTGEEAYSLAMLFREATTTAKRDVKLQIFASDVDPEAVALAREGRFPETIEADVSRARLTRFFAREDGHYRVVPDLRALVVFTVQDLLSDPPFSRIDVVSCRNLMIYLGPEAQGNVVALIHFALRPGGVLLLGSAETIGKPEGRFEVIAKTERLYRRIGRNRPGEFAFLKRAGDGVKATPRAEAPDAPSRRSVLAQLCQTTVLDAHAPATVLLNRRHECLFSLGPVDRFLRVAPGQPSQDLLVMARPGVQTKLRSALQRAARENARVVLPGGRLNQDGKTTSFSIDVQPLVSEGEDLLLVCFVDTPHHGHDNGQPAAPTGAPRIADLERELDAARQELQDATRSLDASGEEQKAINEEASSVREEYQSTNEELLASKEELQALVEELTALNSQLQETLERQRTTSNDLQNVLYSTDVATLFLDADLKIRFFTPATISLFSIIPGDVGRPLADLHALAMDLSLPDDARAVLRGDSPVEREIEGQKGSWFIRRILPYRTLDRGVEGVVITFNDITERKRVAKSLEASQQQAEAANIAKSRFLAAASHDLRQPLQALDLIRGVLAKRIAERRTAEALELVARLDDTTASMSTMLNTLLDINQLEAGTVRTDITVFPINDLLDRLRKEFSWHAVEQDLGFRVVPCSLFVESDAHLLEQMIRNLMSNALKYTKCGKVLIGCRRHGDLLTVEIWDTGIGIANEELQTIFEEYHQIDNKARERHLGLGLGLSIVWRLGSLLCHPVRVRSEIGKGSVFVIEVRIAPKGQAQPSADSLSPRIEAADAARQGGSILIIEDDPMVRDSLALFLTDEGYEVAKVSSVPLALELVANGEIHPDLILADYNLPNGLNGLEAGVELAKVLKREIPVIILTGDISTQTLRDIALSRCSQLTKPVHLDALTQLIRRVLPAALQSSRLRVPNKPAHGNGAAHPTIFVVDDDGVVSAAMRLVLEDAGHSVEVFASCEAFLDAFQPGLGDCLLIDAYLPLMDGFELLQRLRAKKHLLPAIMITGRSDVPMAVRAMKAGASDFIEKPVGRDELLASVNRALDQSRDESKLFAWREKAAHQVADLTPRQHQIMDLVLAGQPSKNIAADLGISQRTVENHRASIMKRTGSKSMPALARLALAAAADEVK
ncbi:chemotaxis protein CheB [Lichenihabitans psoromatis]|uniref:chemotaxis protein CheB n=1 Tax=Lichenihabitans psoromatis TaxID=2528642 RepID=UPI001FE0A1B7|nr:chemotaxis protein CheB [Lichenihabitans psoromatis]